jgi:excisionase family DNA binding protein
MADKQIPGQLPFPELIDIETFAGLLGVGERYVRRIVFEREIEVIKIGHYVRFDLEVVRKWIAARRRPPTEKNNS